MSLVRPFQAYLPAADLAAEVVAPPLGNLTTEEWLRLSNDNPLSFLHVIRTEVDTEGGQLAPVEDARLGRARLDVMIDSGIMRPAPDRGFYVYRIHDGTHAATGIVAEVALAAYRNGQVRRHELTRATTEDLLVDHLERVLAHSDPVALTHRDDAELAALAAGLAVRSPDLSFVAGGGYRHEVWAVTDPAEREAVRRRLDEIAVLYITDGHHRCAAAARFGERHAAATHLPAALFPESELKLLAFHRCLVLSGESPDGIIDAVARVADVTELGSPGEGTAPGRGESVMVVAGAAFRFALPEVAGGGLLADLDVVRLQRGVLGPLFGIGDPQRDGRVHYVAGRDVPRPEQHGCDACFMVAPPDVREVMAVADAGLVMPPKSTRFEPKVAGGLFVRLIDPA